MNSKRTVTVPMLQKLVADLTVARATSTATHPAANQAVFRAKQSSRVQLFQNKTPETEQEVAKLVGALSVISAHVPRGTGSIFNEDGTLADDYWLGVVWALASTGWQCGKEVARTWSRASDRYTEEGFEKAWTDFKSDHPNPVGLGSVYKLAQSLGWQRPSNQTRPYEQRAASPAGYQLLSGKDLLSLPTPSWRVKHLLPQQGLAAIYGPSASGKSFLAFDLAACIVEGTTWFGHKTVAAPVVYVMLEGQSGIQKRVKAWEYVKGKALPDGLSVVLQPVRLNSADDVALLADAIPRGAVVFIDTLNRAAPTADENSSKDMGSIIDGANTLHRLTGGLVILVHHTGKDTSQGMRGHSSLFAALDGAIEVKRSAGGRSWTAAKTKDGEDGKTVAFALRVHSIGVDADGDSVSSCTVEAANAAIFVKAAPSHAGPNKALKEIEQAIAADDKTFTGIPGTPTGRVCMKLEDAVLVVACSLVAVQKSKRTYNARRHITSLTNSGHLGSVIDGNGDSWVWIEP